MTGINKTHNTFDIFGALNFIQPIFFIVLIVSIKEVFSSSES